MRLQPDPASAQGGGALKGTMMGIPQVGALAQPGGVPAARPAQPAPQAHQPPSVQQPPNSNPALGQTVVGAPVFGGLPQNPQHGMAHPNMSQPGRPQPSMPQHSPPTTAGAAPAQPGGLKGTMLGFSGGMGTPAPAQPGPQAGPSVGGAPPPGQPGAAAPMQPAPAQPGGLKGTMIGVAMPAGAGMPPQTPQAAPTPQSPVAAPSAHAAQPPTGAADAAPGAQARVGALKGTVMGVAVPGIAPIHNKKAQTMFDEPLAPSMSQYQVPDFQAPAAPPKRGIPKAAIVLSIVGVVLLAAAGAVAVLWKSPAPMTATAGLNEAGDDVLKLVCESCPAETKILLGNASALFKDGKATLKLEKRLEVGANNFKVAVERPGMGRDEDIELIVPLNYRVTGDLSGLTESPPVLAVRASGIPGAKIAVDGKPLELESGKGRHVISIEDKLKGSSGKVERISLKVPYTVMLPAGGKHEGTVDIDVGVAPLFIEAPGESTVIDEEHFMLAGKTAPGAVVKVAGSPITVDPKGRFAQLYRVDSEGETTIDVEANVKDHAPRKAAVKIKRVKDLRDEAKKFLEKASSSFASIAKDADTKKDLPVALMGAIEEIRLDHQTTIILLDARSGCEQHPCLVRLVSGAKAKVAKGDTITAFGHVAGSVEGPFSKQKVPEVRVAFLMKGNVL